jgi:hypothetical protein
MFFELLSSRQRKSGSFGLPDDASKNAEVAVACLLWVIRVGPDRELAASGIPQVSRHLQSRPACLKRASSEKHSICE